MQPNRAGRQPSGQAQWVGSQEGIHVFTADDSTLGDGQGPLRGARTPPALSSPRRVCRLGAAPPGGPGQGQSRAGLWLTRGLGAAAAGIGREPGRPGLGSPGAETQPGAPGSGNARGQKPGPQSLPRLAVTTRSPGLRAPRTVRMPAQGSCASPAARPTARPTRPGPALWLRFLEGSTPSACSHVCSEEPERSDFFHRERHSPLTPWTACVPCCP